MASGYLKVFSVDGTVYELDLTNHEVELMFSKMVKGWFKKEKSNYNGFITALLQGDLKSMNGYMNRVALNTFSYFDTGKIRPDWIQSGFIMALCLDCL